MNSKQFRKRRTSIGEPVSGPLFTESSKPFWIAATNSGGIALPTCAREGVSDKCLRLSIVTSVYTGR